MRATRIGGVKLEGATDLALAMPLLPGRFLLDGKGPVGDPAPPPMLLKPDAKAPPALAATGHNDAPLFLNAR